MTDDAPKTDGRRKSKNLGRPLGSRDRFPRRRMSVGRTGTDERFKELETAYTIAVGRIAQLENELSAQQRFDGDALSLLRATCRGEYHPTNQQLYSAKVIFEHELDQRRVELDNHRAEIEGDRREYLDGGQRLAELTAEFASFVKDRSDELAALLVSGDVTADGAKVVRSWFIRDEPLALPAPQEFSSAAEPPDAEPITTRPVEPVEFVVEPADAPNAIRVLFAPRPFALFQVSSGRRFEADSASVVELDGADAGDIADLMGSGCRAHREQGTRPL